MHEVRLGTVGEGEMGDHIAWTPGGLTGKEDGGGILTLRSHVTLSLSSVCGLLRAPSLGLREKGIVMKFNSWFLGFKGAAFPVEGPRGPPSAEAWSSIRRCGSRAVLGTRATTGPPPGWIQANSISGYPENDGFSSSGSPCPSPLLPPPPLRLILLPPIVSPPPPPRLSLCLSVAWSYTHPAVALLASVAGSWTAPTHAIPFCAATTGWGRGFGTSCVASRNLLPCSPLRGGDHVSSPAPGRPACCVTERRLFACGGFQKGGRGSRETHCRCQTGLYFSERLRRSPNKQHLPRTVERERLKASSWGSWHLSLSRRDDRPSEKQEKIKMRVCSATRGR